MREAGRQSRQWKTGTRQQDESRTVIVERMAKNRTTETITFPKRPLFAPQHSEQGWKVSTVNREQGWSDEARTTHKKTKYRWWEDTHESERRAGSENDNEKWENNRCRLENINFTVKGWWSNKHGKTKELPTTEMAIGDHKRRQEREQSVGMTRR